MSNAAGYVVLAACSLIAGAATPARADLLVHKDMSAAIAMTLAQTAIATCTTNGYRVSVTVVGRNGEPLVQIRGDNTGPHTMESSLRKAYTARTFRVPSGEIAKRLKEDPAYGAVHLTNVIATLGGLPILLGEEVIGAVGVSGAPGGEKDEVCAKAGIDKVAIEMK